MRVSVICTVLNEASAVERLLDSLAAQTRPPDEVVIVDGGSSDGTQATIMRYGGQLPLKFQEARGANISRGRNLAARRASGDVIASTDAGVRLEPNWLEQLLAPFELLTAEELSATNAAVAGFFQPDPHTTFELALGATTLPAVEDIQPERFLPSSRSVAWSRAAWQCSGGYPEWLDYCEDLLFDFGLIACCGGFAWAPQALVHFRPRPSLRAFFKQYYRYARGDGKADLWRKRHLIRYATYLVALPALLALSIWHHPLWLLALLLGMLAYCRRPVQRLFSQWRGYHFLQKLAALLLIPVIRVVGDVAKMLGYPAGLRWRRQNRARPEVHWRQRPTTTP
ncbi:MAG: glycosyltransferase [Anaerolineae bacterium]